MRDAAFPIFLVVAPGLETALADEARGLGLEVDDVSPGGVACNGSWRDIWRANLELRGATRVLVRIASFRALHLAQLDKRSRKVPWNEWLKTEVPVSVEATCRKSRIYHAKAAVQRVERALEAAGYAVKPRSPVAIKLRIEDDLATVSLDTSGASLHKRGLKHEVNKAPMRETLAALFLRSAGFTGQVTVYDPMCGSGTFVLEAAEIANGLQPGRARSFAFEHLEGFDRGAYDRLKSLPHTQSTIRFFGSDRDAGVIRMSEANAARAGITEVTSFRQAAIGDVIPPQASPGLVIANPPYGGRIGNKGALHGLYGAFGKAMKERFQGWRVALVTSDAGLAKSTALPWENPGPIVDHGGTKIRLWQVQL
ncbi:MAG: class I SAM-dependent RNA methyltransferase [Pseudomonadota bacterium]